MNYSGTVKPDKNKPNHGTIRPAKSEKAAYAGRESPAVKAWDRIKNR